MKVAHDVKLAGMTTLGVGGVARRVVEIEEERELVEVLGGDEPVLVLGGGSNVVVGDRGWDGVVVRLAMAGVAVEAGDGDVVRVEAGVEWDAFVAAMVDEGRVGVECLSGIPGRVGATPMQNVGAYGQEVAETIVDVRAWDREQGAFVEIAKEDCGFAYRSSRFRGGGSAADTRWVITAVRFRLPRGKLSAPIRYGELAKALGVESGGRAELARVRETVIGLRRGKGMVIDRGDPDTRSAGSFFMNPIVGAEAANGLPEAAPRWAQADGRVKLAAAWLIEQAGFAKGMVKGRVGISSKHALALVTREGASAGELLALAGEIRDGVRGRFGVELVMEPVIA